MFFTIACAPTFDLCRVATATVVCHASCVTDKKFAIVQGTEDAAPSSLKETVDKVRANVVAM